MNQERIALLTDSTCDLTPELLEQNRIHRVSLSVFFEDEEYRDAVDLTPDQFYEKLLQHPHLPSTSQPSVGAFVEVLEALKRSGVTQVLGLFLSRKLSGTLQAALAASRMVSGLQCEFLDSKSASWGHGLLLLQARRLIDSGLNLAEVCEQIRDRIEKTTILFAVDTLDALHRGGRIGRAAMFFGKHLGIRPILSMSGHLGEVDVVDKVASRAAAIALIVDLARKHVRAHGLVYGIAVLHSAIPDAQQELLAALLATGEDWKTIIHGRIGAVIGTHLGPDGWGVALC